MGEEGEAFGELRAQLHDTGLDAPARLAAAASLLASMEPGPLREEARRYALRLLGLPESLRSFELRVLAAAALHQRLAQKHARNTERLYRAFAHHRRPTRMPECSPLIEARAAESWQVMIAAPLRDLRAEALNFFAFRALTTWGDDTVLRHFLPRLLELCHEDQIDIEPEIVYGKLSFAGWDHWPAGERQALLDWMLSSWELQLADLDAGAETIESALCRIARACVPLRHPLARWCPCATDRPSHLMHLAWLGRYLFTCRAPPFWSEATFAELRRWAARPEHLEALEWAILTWEMGDEELERAFDEALWVLETKAEPAGAGGQG